MRPKKKKASPRVIRARMWKEKHLPKSRKKAKKSGKKTKKW